MKKNVKITIAILSVVVAALIAVCISVSIKRNETISLESVYEYYPDVLKKAEKNSQNSAENAEKLYNAILANESITPKEKKHLTSYIQYFVDNKYIDCDHVCDKLASFTITENDPSLLDLGISAEYKEENSITFANDEERAYSLSHELHHCIENENLSYEYYGWFGEGFAELVIYEYFNQEASGWGIQTFFVRGLCEIVGPEVLFKVSATGDITVLENALAEKGINQKTAQEAFELFTQLKDGESFNGVLTEEQKFEAVWKLVELYNIANDYPDDITYSFYMAVGQMYGDMYGSFDHYYLNSAKTNKSYWQQRHVPQTKLEELYNDITMTVY